MKDPHTKFMGTYFDKDAVLKLSRAARIIAWIVLGVYGAQFLLNLGIDLSQIFQGFGGGKPFLLNFPFILKDLVTGGVYFFILMGIAQFLLILLDVEDNTRRAARQ